MNPIWVVVGCLSRSGLHVDLRSSGFPSLEVKYTEQYVSHWVYPIGPIVDAMLVLTP